MNAEDLDLAYTEFCQAMTEVGEENAPLFLARFSLLAMTNIGNLDHLRRLIADAAALQKTNTEGEA